MDRFKIVQGKDPAAAAGCGGGCELQTLLTGCSFNQSIKSQNKQQTKLNCIKTLQIVNRNKSHTKNNYIAQIVYCK